MTISSYFFLKTQQKEELFSKFELENCTKHLGIVFLEKNSNFSDNTLHD